jgi:hypothetical protein
MEDLLRAVGWDEVRDWLDRATPWPYVVIMVALVAIVILVVVAAEFFRGRDVQIGTSRWLRAPIRANERLSAPVKDASVANADRTDETTLERWQHHAVGIEHSKLLAAETAISQIVEHLATESAPWALTVSGEGGIGKTAVTYEAVKRVARLQIYSRIIWAAAKTQGFGQDEADAEVPRLVNWEDVVGAIGSQLACELGPRKLWETQVAEYIRSLPHGERVLVVVDNLEGVDDAERTLERTKRLGIERPHRLVATSRWTVQRHDMSVPDVPLRPLGLPDTIELAKSLGGANEDLRAASSRKLEPIHRISEGNPFLIKLIVHRYLHSALSLQETIDELTRTQDNLTPGAALGARVREWLYERSLDELAARTSADLASDLMAAFCFFPRGASVPREKLQQRSGIATNDFRRALEAAYDLALVRVSKDKSEYSVHSLLYEYTSAEYA